MGIPRFNDQDLQALVRTLGASKQLAVIVGAGVSMEAGLPPWPELIRRLLGRAYDAHPDLGSSGDAPLERESWIEETLSRHGHLGAAAVVEGLYREELSEWLLEELYGEKKAEERRFGPTAEQIARLYDLRKGHLALVTTNYDDLLEQALRSLGHDPLSLSSPPNPIPKGQPIVWHLHGYVDDEPPDLTLTEAHFQRIHTTEPRSWQERLLKACMRGSCLFVGTSLDDPTLIRSLHLAKDGEHGERAALFVRALECEARTLAPPEQYCPILTDYDMKAPLLPETLIGKLELARAARWSECGLKVVHLDHTADVAQFLAEVGLAAKFGGDYVDLPARAATLSIKAEDALLGGKTRAGFRELQDALNDWIRGLVRSAWEAARNRGVDFSSETIGASLWLITPDGQKLLNCCSTDQKQVAPQTLNAPELDERSDWTAMHAYCVGKVQIDETSSYASPWKYVIGIPLTPDDSESMEVGRLPIGCLTLASTAPYPSTALSTMDEDIRAEMIATLRDGALDYLAAATDRD